MAIEGIVGVTAGVIAGSVALTGFGLDSAIEGAASVIVIWRFTGSRELSHTSERRAQKAVALSFLLLAPYLAADAIYTLVSHSPAHTSWLGIGLSIASLIAMPLFARAKTRLGQQLDSPATTGKERKTFSAPTWPPACSPGCSPTPPSAGGGLTL